MLPQLVEDVYDICEDWLHSVSEDGSYWEASYRFYNEVKKKPVEKLSDKQKEWLNKLENKYLSQAM